MKKRNVLLVVAGIVMIVLGIKNFLKGNEIISATGLNAEAPGWTSAGTIYFAGIGTMVIAIGLIICGIFLLRELLYWSWYLTTVGLFLVMSVYVNAYIYGEALGSGVVIDFTFGLLVICLLWLGARRLK